MKLSLSVSPSGTLTLVSFSLALRLCPEPWPVLLPPVKFAGRTTPPIDSLHPRDHKLLNSIQDPALGAAELHPDGNCGSRGHGVLTFCSVGRHPPRPPLPRARRLLCGGAWRTFSASQPTPPYGEPRDGELLLHLRRGGTRGPAGTAAPKRGRRGSARASSRADCHPRSPRAREGTAAGAAGSHHM